MSTLYELTSEYLQLMNMLYDEDEDLDCILDTMEGVDFELDAASADRRYHGFR